MIHLVIDSVTDRQTDRHTSRETDKQTESLQHTCISHLHTMHYTVKTKTKTKSYCSVHHNMYWQYTVIRYHTRITNSRLAKSKLLLHKSTKSQTKRLQKLSTNNVNKDNCAIGKYYAADGNWWYLPFAAVFATIHHTNQWVRLKPCAINTSQSLLSINVNEISISYTNNK